MTTLSFKYLTKSQFTLDPSLSTVAHTQTHRKAEIMHELCKTPYKEIACIMKSLLAYISKNLHRHSLTFFACVLLVDVPGGQDRHMTLPSTG